MRVVMLLHKSVQFDSRVRREARVLAQAAHEVIVLELASLPERQARLDGFARRSCAPPEWVKRRVPFHLYRLVFLAMFLREIVRARPDVIHAHDAAMLLPGSIGARLTGAKLVYDSHELASSVPYRERMWAAFVSGIERLTIGRCEAVITVSDGIAQRLRERYRLARKPTVLRNVSELRVSGRGGLRASLGIDRQRPLILHQGAPAPDRGCEVLIAATREVQAHLVFLGSGEPEFVRGLTELASSCEMSERMSILPSVPLEDLLAHTAEADVGVTLLQDTCENHRLALPNKLFEYITAGVPVVASDLPEMRTIVEGYRIGWCVRPDDPRAVAEGLRLALESRGDAQLAERLRKAAGELCWEVERHKLTDLYVDLSGREAMPGLTRAPA